MYMQQYGPGTMGILNGLGMQEDNTPINGMRQPTVAPLVQEQQKPQAKQSGMGGAPMPGLGMISKFAGGGAGAGGGATGATGAAAGAEGAAGAGTAGGAGLGSGLGAVFSNPITGLVGAAVGGAASLSADSDAAGTGGQWENWLGPIYNVPKAISSGDWDKAMKDGAMGPVGGVYNIANGKNPLTSIANSMGPAGQVPALLAQGELPYSGGNTSKHYINAFTGAGI